MPEDNQAIENRNKGQDAESARQELTIAQRKKRESNDPRDYIPGCLDGEEITVTLIEQLHTELSRAYCRIDKFAPADENYPEGDQSYQQPQGPNLHGPIYSAAYIEIAHSFLWMSVPNFPVRLTHHNLRRFLIQEIPESQLWMRAEKYAANVRQVVSR